jgi:hypothetical protein
MTGPGGDWADALKAKAEQIRARRAKNGIWSY